MKYFILSTFLVCASLTAHSQWTTKANLGASARNHPVTFSIDGLGYVFTGYRTTAGQVFSDGLSYDPETDSWSNLSNFPGGARGFAVGDSYNGKGYLGFGVNPAGFLNDLWEYEPSSDTWTELASCPCLARRHPAFTITSNGKIYVGLGNGNDAQGDAVAGFGDWWEYNISTDSWAQMPDLPAAGRHHPYFFSLGTDAYVGFGDNHVTIFKDFYKFNSLTSQWTTLNDFPGESRVAGAQFSYGEYGYIVDGEGSDHQNLDDGEFYRYDPSTDTWETFASHSGDGLWAPGAFVIDSMVYVTGGDNGANASMITLWAYSLERHPVDKAMTSAGSTYTLDEDFFDEDASYQWIDCNDNNAELADETNSTVNVPEGGSYALVVTYAEGGIDTSACYNGSPTGIDDGLSDFEKQFKIYPNPAKDWVQFQNFNELNKNLNYTIVNYSSVEVESGQIDDAYNGINLGDLSVGLYLLVIKDEEGTVMNAQRIIKLE